jgi:hypothetical protein
MYYKMRKMFIRTTFDYTCADLLQLPDPQDFQLGRY